MARRATHPIHWLVAFCWLSFSLPCSAQLPSAQDLCVASTPSSNVDGAGRKAIIGRIDFDGPIHLSKSDVARIIKEVNQKEFLDAADPTFINWFTEERLRDAWQAHGYFKAHVTSQARSLGGNSSKERFLVTTHVDEGLQYHLRNIRFVGDSTFPDTELRATVPLRDGEIFNVGLIRTGLEALTRLYDSNGYIDFTAVPDTQIDHDLQPWISLVFTLDPQQQYRVGNVEIGGLDPKLEARLRAVVQPGQIYHPYAVADFFKENKSVLPSGLSPLRVRRNVKAGTVDLMFVFRTCP